jgi:hypothetical protein
MVIDGGRLACGNEVILAVGCPCTVLTSKDNEWCKTKAKEGEDRGRMWMRIPAIAEAYLSRTATSYYIVGSLAEGQ